MVTFEADVDRMVHVLAALRPVLPTVVPGPACDHVGGVLADVALQAGLNYDTVVAPRVTALIRRYPSARTASGALRLVHRFSAEHMLDWRHPEKPARFVALLRVCLANGADTMADVRSWTGGDECSALLRAVPGIGPKSADYLRRLAGHATFPMDRHLLRIARAAGLRNLRYDYAQAVLARGSALAGLDARTADHALWRLAREYA